MRIGSLLICETSWGFTGSVLLGGACGVASARDVFSHFERELAR